MMEFHDDDAARGYADIDTRWAANEKVALEIAAGVAYSGAAALVVMKHVGVNVAADPLFNLAYTGVRGALVVVVGDDPGASCSQNEQDTRLIGVAAHLPVLEPSDVAEAMLYTRLAFLISREFDLPVIVRLTTQLCYATQPVVTAERQATPPAGGFAAPTKKYLLLPSHVPARHRALVAALDRFGASAWSSFFCREHWPAERPPAGSGERYPVGLVCAGHTYAQVRELLEDKLPILQVGCAFPLPAAAVARFASRCERLVVTEECSNHLRDLVRAAGHDVAALAADSVVGEFRFTRLRQAGIPALTQWVDTLSPPVRAFPLSLVGAPATKPLPALPDAPLRPPGFCAGCSHVGAFDVLRSLGRYVVGDIGCYTLGATPAFAALQSNLCMGASVGVLQGYLAMQPDRRHDVIAVIGDSTFFHSGIPSLLTAVNNGTQGTLLILDNSGTAMTGFQRTGPNLDAAGWDKLLEGLGVVDRAVVPAFDIGMLKQRIEAFDASKGPAVIVLKGLCVQGRERQGPTSFRYTVNASACTGCGECKRRTDCPSLELTTDAEGKVRFEIGNACIGCGMCAQTCPEHAILPRTVATGLPLVDRALGHVPWERVIRFVNDQPTLRRLAARFERELA